MKKEQLYVAIGEIKETYIQEARQPNEKKIPPWTRWCPIAASLAAVLMVAFFGLNGKLWNTDLPATNTADATEETAFGTRYVYRVDQESYSSYCGAKVIDPERIGGKLEEVTVTAGWITEPSQEPAGENLRGEIYEIKGVSPDIAVALWFLDKGEALTTTHYYVIVNPAADLSPVADYVIPDYVPNDNEE